MTPAPESESESRSTPPPPRGSESMPVEDDEAQNPNRDGVRPPAPAPAPAAGVEADVSGSARPEEDPAEKQRVQDQLRQESRKRGNRMFGVMLGTLKRAKQQVDTSSETDAMKKRLELEKKLNDKLQGERKVIEERTEREKDVRELKMTLQKKEEEISSADAIYRVRHDAKHNLAGFLCTSFPLPTPAPTTDAISVPFTPRLPHSTRVTGPVSTQARPIYYLPYRLLPSQEDRIEDQVESVKLATKRDDDEWRDVRLAKQRDVTRLRDELNLKVEDLARLEREDRQRKRREAEQRDELLQRDKRRRIDDSPPPPRGGERRAREGRDERAESRRGGQSDAKDPAVPEKAQDVDMAGADNRTDGVDDGRDRSSAAEVREGQAENGRSSETLEPEREDEGARKGDDEDDDKMELVAGEEDLEY